MRLWHLFVVILALGLVLAIVRDQVGRIALIVFVTALGEAIIGTTAILALFQTIGAHRRGQGTLRPRRGRRDDRARRDHRDDRHVVAGCSRAPGWSRRRCP